MLTKTQKRPPKYQKIKCLFLDYFQLLMIGQAIWAKNIDQNAKIWKRPPKSLKNKIFTFGLHSTSDDWLSDLSDEWWLKCKKRPPKSSKNKMFIFDGLPEDHQKTVRRKPEDKQKTSRRQAEDYQKSSRRPAETTRRLPEDHQKTTRRLPEDHQTISWAIWAKNIETKMQKTEKGPLSHWKIKCSFLD